jgi:hypothetical protein
MLLEAQRLGITHKYINFSDQRYIFIYLLVYDVDKFLEVM